MSRNKRKMNLLEKTLVVVSGGFVLGVVMILTNRYIVGENQSFIFIMIGIVYMRTILNDKE